MEVIKRKISFEPATVRYTGGTQPYGTMTADTFYVKIMLTQNFDDMGIYTDINFEKEDINTTPDYTILTDKLTLSGYTFPFMIGQQPPTPTTLTNEVLLRPTNKDLNDYWVYGNEKISGFTDTKKSDVKSYDETQKFIVGFDVDKEQYVNYIGNNVDGRTRVTQLASSGTSGENPFTYVFDANNDVNIGTVNQDSGILYREYTGDTVVNIVPNNNSNIARPRPNEPFNGKQRVTFQFTGEGWNETNTSLSALTKEEYLFGITQVPEVQSDVFIDRGSTTVFEKHLRLSEVESLKHLEKYNNSFYRLVKQ